MISKLAYLLALCAASCTADATTDTLAPTLPIVDLGYAIHQASLVNASNRYYNFSNIRYAAPPLGDLRFAAPLPPLYNRSAGIQDGSYGNICPQQYPKWLSTFAKSSDPGLLQTLSLSPGMEDCLFLDVVVPQKTFQRKLSNAAVGLKSRGAPVLVWIYGGGYVAGDKNTGSNPVGLLSQSQEDTIFVSFNYRLGAFGFLAGPTLQSNGTANAGLLDQRLALEWIQTHIHLFGGDPSRVTLLAESAGGGSIMHHITAYGGIRDKRSPFQQAIVQSPGFLPFPGHFEQEQVFMQFLKVANASSLRELRKLPQETLMNASAEVIANASYGTFAFGPVVDGSFVPDLPGKLLLQGNFDHNLKVMVGHNANEGLIFTDPNANNTTGYNRVLKNVLSTSTQQVLDYISQVLYPENYNGSYSYTNAFNRLDLTISELFFTCNTNYISRAFANTTYAYLFSLPPALHGQDTPYVFFDGPNPAVVNTTLATILQKYILQFAATGSPNAIGLPTFPQYGNESSALNLNQTQISLIKDPTANERCLWWQKALYL
ncbi:Alpha/Beta hydrolase protein [Xylogone sp. PMI_703]|nr:Alpha/Beta hydrolase protein [Xylogone sp. PMI_703]